MHAARRDRFAVPVGAGSAEHARAAQRGSHEVQRAAIEYVEAALAAGWLCFESSAGKRRLAPIPSGWESMPPDSLSTLCERATPVTPRQRRG